MKFSSSSVVLSLLVSLTLLQSTLSLPVPEPSASFASSLEIRAAEPVDTPAGAAAAPGHPKDPKDPKAHKPVPHKPGKLAHHKPGKPGKEPHKPLKPRALED